MDQLGFRHLVGVAVLGASLCWDLPAQDTSPERRDQTLLQDVDEAREVALHQSSYWIGVVGAPVEDVVRVQLGLPEGQGLVIQSVVPDSPAAAAGLQEYDILTELDGQPLQDLGQLITAIEAAKETPIKVTGIRQGKSMVSTITPEKRPEEMVWSQPPYGSVPSGSGWEGPQVDSDALRQWVDKLARNPNQPGPPMAFRFFGPGIPQDEEGEGFSGNLSVQINKEDDRPARIVVKRDEETWEITEDQIDQLPEDLRGYIRGMLGKNGNLQMYVLPSHGGHGSGGPDMPLPMLPDVPMPPNIQQQFDQMNQRMEEMLEQLKELRTDQQEDDSVDA